MNYCVFTLSLAWWVSQTSAYYRLVINTNAFTSPSGTTIASDLPHGPNFGFSIAFYPNKNNKSLIVSDPTANSIGKLFSCSVSDIAKSSCVEWKIANDDRMPLGSPNLNIGIGNLTMNHLDKINAWFGATVSADHSHVVACAPRVEDKVPTARNQKGTFGMCFMNNATQNENVMEYVPRMSHGDQFIYTEPQPSKFLTSFGWSSAIGNQQAIFGGPATHRDGALVLEDWSKKKKPIPIYSKNYFEGTKVYNLGYSVAIGSFFNESESVYALGTPYGDHGVGKVIFFEKSPNAIPPADQTKESIGYFVIKKHCDLDAPGVPGAMFAAAMCTANLDQDGRTDLLVGAPAFSDRSSHMFEVGAVYVYYGMTCPPTAEAKPRIIKGTQARGRFGMAIANIGDMDNDNIDDFVIAAPYDDDGRGAIYVHTGASLLTAQLGSPKKIQPQKNQGFYNFGFSLAPLQEYDDIGSSGLAVGGLGNNAVAFLYQVPTYQVTISTIVPPNDLKAYEDGKFTLQSCFKFQYPSKPTVLTAYIEMSVTIHHDSAKLAGDKNVFRSELLVNNTLTDVCENVEVVLPATGNYVNNSIECTITARVPEGKDPLTADAYKATDARLLDQDTNRHHEVLWSWKCAGGSCEPDLRPDIKSTMSEPYLMGSSESELLHLTVSNRKDRARSHCASICVLQGTAKLGLRKGCTRSRDERCLQCSPNNILTTENPWLIGDVKLITSSFTSDDMEVIIEATAYNDCKNKTAVEKDLFNRTIQHDPATVTLKGKNQGGQDNVKMNETQLIQGKEIIHEYTVVNEGKTIWTSLQSRVELEPRPYLSYDSRRTLKVITKTTERICVIDDTINTTMKFNVTCDLDLLRPGEKIDIWITILVKDYNKGMFEKNVTVTSSMTIEKINKFQSVTTLLVPVKTKVELWIIIAAALSGVFFLVLIAFALYKCGFLKRKKREQLLIRKESVRRESMRISAIENRRSQHRESALSQRNSMYACFPEPEAEHGHRLSTAVIRRSRGSQQDSTHRSGSVHTEAEIHL